MTNQIKVISFVVQSGNVSKQRVQGSCCKQSTSSGNIFHELGVELWDKRSFLSERNPTENAKWKVFVCPFGGWRVRLIQRVFFFRVLAFRFVVKSTCSSEMASVRFVFPLFKRFSLCLEKNQT